MEFKVHSSIEIFTVLDSTQAELKRRLHSDSRLPHLHSILAGTQTGGRGRLDHRWESISGNLHASILIRNLPPIGLTWVPHWVGCGIVAALEESGIDPQLLKLKWPNDVMRRDEAGEWTKVGGILCEKIKEDVLVGIGLNLSSAPPMPAVSALGISNPKAVLTQIQSKLSRPVTQAFVQERYSHLAYFQSGDAVEWIQESDSSSQSGKVIGLGHYGELKVRSQDTELALFSETVHKVRPLIRDR